MKVDKREALQKNSQIVLTPYFGDGNNVTFHIEKENGRGSSAICYDAYYYEGDVPVWGTLKEYYPCDFDPSPAFDVVRNDAVDDYHRGQLYSKKGTLQNFLTYKEGYVHPYDVLRRVRGKRGLYPLEINELNKFLPDPELYKGFGRSADDPDNCSVYVWVKNEPSFERFSDILQKVCVRMQDENYNSISDVSLILNCIYKLAVCIDALHFFSLYHLDLKPENFGIAISREKHGSLVDSISLYDVNSLYSGRGRHSVVLSSGTKYFRSPEVRAGDTGKYGILSDIYSLGAILYHAMVVKAEENDMGTLEYKNVRFCEGGNEFNEEAYNTIGVHLRNSRLLDNSDETENSIIFRKLYLILLKSLNTTYYHNAFGFYKTAEEFARDLMEVIESLQRSAGNAALEKNTGYHIESNFNKMEEHLAAQNKNGAKGVIQWLLYQYPLYDYCVKREGSEAACNVLVLGGATFASKFVDLAFELSQVKDCRLNITVASKDFAEDKTTYLATRPGMSDFFEIDGEPPKMVSEPYGRLSFVEVHAETDTEGVWRESIRPLFAKHEEEQATEQKYTYVFIALGEERRNQMAAKACAFFLKDSRQKALIGYTVFDKKTESGCDSTLQEGLENTTVLRLSVFDSLEKHTEYRFLRQMAFNAHLIWHPDFINDMQSARAQFRSKYNFDSSFDNALSIPYKLHSVDPDLTLDFSNPHDVAAKVAKICANPQIIGQLTMHEHRRWIVEKITESWTTLTDLSSLHSTTKDDTKRRHPCIVDSTSAAPLSTPKWNNYRHSLWNTAGESEKATLDDLDRLSIEMHQHFLREAENLREDSKKLSAVFARIQDIAARDSLAYCAYEGLRDTVDALSARAKDLPGNVKRYRYYKKQLRGGQFLGSDQKGSQMKKELKSALDELDRIVFPVMQAASFKNWKSVDANLNMKIPFILTYQPALHLCVPFFMETKENRDTTSLFGNMAAALMLNPQYVTFIVDGDAALENLGSFISSLEYCSNIIKNHKIQTSINVQLLRNEKNDFGFETLQRILNVSDKISFVGEIPYEGWNQVERLHEFLVQKSVNFHAIELNNTRISGLLQSANLIFGAGNRTKQTSDDGVFPMYTFNSLDRTFETTNGCRYFSYVGNTPSLLVDDLFLLRDKNFKFTEPELVKEYKKLWTVYTGKDPNARDLNTWIWKRLTKAIKDHMQQSNRIARFELAELREAEKLEEYRTCLPAFCKDGLDRILSVLKNHKLNESEKSSFFDDYHFERNASNSVVLIVKNVRKSVKERIEAILAFPMNLAEKNLLDFAFCAGCVDVFSRALRVKNLVLPEMESDDKKRSLEQLINQLKTLKCIRAVSYSGDKKSISFTFATEQHLRLLMNEGSILETYIYREAVESQMFDDVKTGVTVYWDNYGSSNQMDVILIKGLQTMIVEIKATALEQGFYDKLYPLCKTFGVNTVPVILADLAGKESINTQRQIARGKELGIRTIIDANNSAVSLHRLFPLH